VYRIENIIPKSSYTVECTFATAEICLLQRCLAMAASPFSTFPATSRLLILLKNILNDLFFVTYNCNSDVTMYYYVT
jgi:hypothetical protein